MIHFSPNAIRQVYLGSMDISDQFSSTYVSKLTGERGMRVMTFTIEKVNHNFIAKPEYDGQIMRCIATVPGLGTNETFAHISVDCEYSISMSV